MNRDALRSAGSVVAPFVLSLSKDDPLDKDAWFDRLTTNVWLQSAARLLLTPLRMWDNPFVRTRRAFPSPAAPALGPVR